MREVCSMSIGVADYPRPKVGSFESAFRVGRALMQTFQSVLLVAAWIVIFYLAAVHDPNQSRRSQPLPANWQRIRRRVLRRDGGVCRICGRPGADQVDHIVPASQGGSDDMSNLAAIHEYPCHARKTAQEALAKNFMAQPRRRAEERHPGDLV